MSLTAAAGRFSSRLALLALAAVVALLAAATAAYGYLHDAGHGTGTVQVATLQIQVQALAGGDANTTLLLPGHTADAIVRLYNPNPVDVQLVSVAGDGTPTASNGCAPTGVQFMDLTGLSMTLPAGSTVLVRLPGSVSMSAAAAAACQGASFRIPVTVTVRR